MVNRQISANGKDDAHESERNGKLPCQHFLCLFHLFACHLFLFYLMPLSFSSFSMESTIEQMIEKRNIDFLRITFVAAITSRCFGSPSSIDESDPTSSLQSLIHEQYFGEFCLFLFTLNHHRMNIDIDLYFPIMLDSHPVLIVYFASYSVLNLPFHSTLDFAKIKQKK